MREGGRPRCWTESDREGVGRVRFSTYGEVIPLNSSRIPETDVPDSRNPWPLSKKTNPVTSAEIANLKKFTDAGCTSTPHLLGSETEKPAENSWLPGGYVVYILMQLVPGVSLENIRELPRQERDQARKAFMIALE
jgi:hypothetical protein